MLGALAVVAGGFALSPQAGAAAGAVATPAAFEPGGPAPSSAPAVADNSIKARLDQGTALTVAGERLHVALLRRFYAGHGDQPVWDTRPDAAKALWAAVMRAGDHGLDPDMFHAAALANPAGLAATDRELLLSDALLAFADALARGAVPVEQRPGDQALTPGPTDVVAALDGAIGSPQPGAALDALAPATPAYASMRAAYAYYQTIVKAGGWPHVDGADTSQLQQRLAGENYLPAGYDSGRLDEQTVAALKSFQERHGIEPDGKLGAGTLAELNIGADSRVQQIAVGLERLRWLPRTACRRTASGSIPRRCSSSTTAMSRPPSRPASWSARSTSRRRSSRRRSTACCTIRPGTCRSISPRRRSCPSSSDEPDYLERHHMVMRENGAINQLPGAGTALGRLKFEMEDRFDVYLHDTPQRFLFARENRRLSHGCVRVQNPRELASLLHRRAGRGRSTRASRSNTTNRHCLPAADAGLHRLPDRLCRQQTAQLAVPPGRVSARRRDVAAPRSDRAAADGGAGFRRSNARAERGLSSLLPTRGNRGQICRTRGA